MSAKTDEVSGHLELLYPSEYIKVADLHGKDVTVILDRLTWENLTMAGGKKDRKVTVHLKTLQGRPLGKRWVIGKTVLRQIGGVLGETDVAKWRGGKVTLYATTCKSGSGTVIDCIRVRPRVSQSASEVTEDMVATPAPRSQFFEPSDDASPPSDSAPPVQPRTPEPTPAARILAALTAAQDLAAVDAATLDFDAACKAQQIRKSEGQQIRLVIAARREALTQPGQQATNDTGTQESETVQ